MIRILVSAVLISLVACPATNDKEAPQPQAGENAAGSEAVSAKGAKQNTAETTTASKSAVSDKPKLTKEQAMKALMTPPGQRETPAERAERIRKSLENDNPAERLFPKGKPDPAAQGKVLSDDKRSCVDNCFNGLDVERVCETRTPPEMAERKEALTRCHEGARKFCGDRCRMNAPQPTRQRPLPEPEVVDAAAFSKRHQIKPGQKLYTTLITNQGTMIGELFWEKVPNTVANLWNLQRGSWLY